MYDKNDPSILWVSSSADGGGDGTHENPFGDVGRAITIVKPGMTLLLRAGEYRGDRTFDISGTIHQPIRIAAEPGAAVEIKAACWFFYDVSDVIVSGLVFRDTPYGALSVIGGCSRNRFDNLRFINCGTCDDPSCTLFFGGSGGSCTMVENCRFERPALRNAARASVGLMVGEGDEDGGEPIIDHVFRRNYFVNYDYGILVGASDAPAGQYGHVVEHNTVEQCGSGGIFVKCSDTTVRGNRVARCAGSGISIVAGRDSVVESNRVVECGSGVLVNGRGHTVANNCLVRCGKAVRVNAAPKSKDDRALSNILIENNTFVDNGNKSVGGAGRVAGVRIDAGVTAIVRRNLFSGEGKPYAAAAADSKKIRSLIIDNISTNGCEAMEGAAAAEVAFKNAGSGDFTNDSGFGATGMVLTPATFDPESDTVDGAEECSCGHGAFDDEEPQAEFAETEGSEPEDFEKFMSRFYSKEPAQDNPSQR